MFFLEKPIKPPQHHTKTLFTAHSLTQLVSERVHPHAPGGQERGGELKAHSALFELGGQGDFIASPQKQQRAILEPESYFEQKLVPYIYKQASKKSRAPH